MFLYVSIVVHGDSYNLHPGMSLKPALVATHTDAQLAFDSATPEQAL